MKSVLWISLLGAVAASIALNVWGQSGPIVGDDSHIIPYKELLRSKGIATTPTALASALRNDDSSVRSYAAAVLAETGASDAKILIGSALAVERNPVAKMEMASTLMGLGGPAGEKKLSELCMSSSEAATTIASASFQLVLRNSGGQCVDQPLRRLQSAVNAPGDIPTLLASIGPLYKVASEAQQGRIIQTLKRHMSDPEQATRLAVSRSLTQASTPLSRDVLQNALMNEKDSIVRATIQSDLMILSTAIKD